MTSGYFDVALDDDDILYNNNNEFSLGYCHSRCWCRFLLSTLRTSLTNRIASNIGKRLSNAVSVASENQLFIGIALSKRKQTLIKHIHL